jgi:hypothetical protein
MSNYTFPLPAGVLSQPSLEVFPSPVQVVDDELVQLDQQECFGDWVQIESDVAVDTYGPWVEGIASTIRANSWFTWAALFNVFTDETWNGMIDIGVGAAGLEVPVVSEIPYQWSGGIFAGGSAVATIYTGPIEGGIPAGSRVSVRHKDNTPRVQASHIMVNLLA